MTDRLLVLFDRDCGICAATAGASTGGIAPGGWSCSPSNRPRPTTVRSSARSPPGTRSTTSSTSVDLESGIVTSGGRAFLEIAGRLPGGRIPAALGRLPPAAWAIGLGYALVARNRRAISRALRLDTVCAVPPASGS